MTVCHRNYELLGIAQVCSLHLHNKSCKNHQRYFKRHVQSADSRVRTDQTALVALCAEIHVHLCHKLRAACALGIRRWRHGIKGHGAAKYAKLCQIKPLTSHFGAMETPALGTLMAIPSLLVLAGAQRYTATRNESAHWQGVSVLRAAANMGDKSQTGQTPTPRRIHTGPLGGDTSHWIILDHLGSIEGSDFQPLQKKPSIQVVAGLLHSICKLLGRQIHDLPGPLGSLGRSASLQL